VAFSHSQSPVEKRGLDEIPPSNSMEYDALHSGYPGTCACSLFSRVIGVRRELPGQLFGVAHPAHRLWRYQVSDGAGRGARLF
jgi:hypothetical protein